MNRDELRDQIAETLQMAFVALLGNHETSTTGPLTYEILADAALAAPALRVRLDLLAEYENAITWNTSCLACSRTLDTSIRDHDRAERAEAAIKRARDLAEELAGLAPGDEWGETVADTLAADVARSFLAALSPASGSEKEGSSPEASS
jgi:hypothetical protein